MTPALKTLVWMTLFTWAVIMMASLCRARAWTPRGMGLAMGNRDDMPMTSQATSRLSRAAANTIENYLLFAVLVLVAHAAGADQARVALGATVFFWARVAYVFVYWAGIPLVRTGVWGVAICGLGIIVSALI